MAFPEAAVAYEVTKTQQPDGQWKAQLDAFDQDGLIVETLAAQPGPREFVDRAVTQMHETAVAEGLVPLATVDRSITTDPTPAFPPQAD